MEELDKHQSQERDLRRATERMREAKAAMGPVTEILRPEREDAQPAETLAQEALRLSQNTKNEHYKITSYCLERCSVEIERLKKAAANRSFQCKTQPTADPPQDCGYEQYERRPMKAFSLWQPWASLWCSPAKKHETRGPASNFDRSYRGWLAVQATKKFVRDVHPDLEDILDSEFGGHWGMDLPTGAIIGVVKIVGIHRTEDVYPPDRMHLGLPEDQRDDWVCGDFTPGRFAIERDLFAKLDRPIPYRGQQGRYFDIPDFPALADFTQEERHG